MIIFTNKIYKTCSFYVDQAIRAMYWKNQIPSQELQDIKSNIILHIYNKRYKYNESKCKNINGWIRICVNNKLKNEIRRLFAYRRKSKEKIFDFNKVVFRTRLYNEEILYEPDMIIEEIDEFNVDDFSKSLSHMELKLLNGIRYSKNVSSAAKRLGWNRCYAQRILDKIRLKANKYINSHE